MWLRNGICSSKLSPASLATVLLAAMMLSGCSSFSFMVAEGDKPAAITEVTAAQRALPYQLDKRRTQAPFAFSEPDLVANYSRVAPYIGTGGKLKDGALPKLKADGITTVVSLLTAAEGVAEEGQLARDAGLQFRSIALDGSAINPESVTRLAAILSEPDNYPILVHCASSNRAGAMWALYRQHMGVPLEFALQDGRAAGMKASMEKRVLELVEASH